MYASFYKDKLYPFQDEVLKVLEDVDTPFYLTGGTALSRVYLRHRFSDDLDFFQNQSATFSTDAQRMIEVLQQHFLVRPSVRDESFFRVFVRRKNEDTELKIAWINDVQYHKGEIIKTPVFSKVDSWINILSNKITALERNASKDMADIIFLCLHYPIDWKEVIEDARKKDAWVNEIVASQKIYDFDPTALSEVLWIDQVNKTKDFSTELKIIARELLHGFQNSCVK
jgi:hypothetical protein